MKAYWQLSPGLFRPKTCENWIDAALNLPPVAGQVGHGGKESVTDETIRRSNLRWLNRDMATFTRVWDRILELFHEANSASFGFDLWRMVSLQFTEYDAKQQDFYNWHEDITWVRSSDMAHRKLSMVIQLSKGDSYKGGEFQLKGHSIDSAKLRQQGTVIVFPSFLTHRVTPVTEGKRYSLVAWMEGPTFR